MADSIEKLAGKIGADLAVLKTTVDQYNGFCEKGHDDLFAKDQKVPQAAERTKVLRRKEPHGLPWHPGWHQDQ